MTDAFDAADLTGFARKRFCSHPVEVKPDVFVRCHSPLITHCESCATLNADDWRAIARSGIYDAEGRPVPGFAFAFITLTAPSFGEVLPSTGTARRPGTYRYDDQIRWHQALPRLWNAALSRMRRLAPSLEYFAVREWQRRGALHMHIVTRVPVAESVPASVLGAAAAGVEVVHPLTGEIHSWGSIWDARDIDSSARPEHHEDVRASESSNPARLIWYVSKALGYSQKSVTTDRPLTPRLAAHRIMLEAAARRVRCAQCPAGLPRACTQADHDDWGIADWRDCPRCSLGGDAALGDCPARSHRNLGAPSQVVTYSRTTARRTGWSLTGLTRRRQREARQAWMADHADDLVLRGLDEWALSAAAFVRAADSRSHRPPVSTRPAAPHAPPHRTDVSRSAALASLSWHIAPMKRPRDWHGSTTDFMRWLDAQVY